MQRYNSFFYLLLGVTSSEPLSAERCNPLLRDLWSEQFFSVLGTNTHVLSTQFSILHIMTCNYLPQEHRELKQYKNTNKFKAHQDQVH